MRLVLHPLFRAIVALLCGYSTFILLAVIEHRWVLTGLGWCLDKVLNWSYYEYFFYHFPQTCGQGPTFVAQWGPVAVDTVLFAVPFYLVFSLWNRKVPMFD